MSTSSVTLQELGDRSADIEQMAAGAQKKPLQDALWQDRAPTTLLNGRIEEFRAVEKIVGFKSTRNRRRPAKKSNGIPPVSKPVVPKRSAKVDVGAETTLPLR
ncbi:hypothetical protein BP6252_05007 [Coleophoma cylindrospora]|uniref:Uncharacterized protein n=1 Tax=Coleophoma cylindrospora TaxID=1849047 RepID=A0A3D8RSV3_9HELO|nr:hypothetical protein BP6252_05007 [Coleophoma cylindrospora]